MGRWPLSGRTGAVCAALPRGSPLFAIAGLGRQPVWDIVDRVRSGSRGNPLTEGRLRARLAAGLIAIFASDEPRFARALWVGRTANSEFEIFGIPGATNTVADITGPLHIAANPHGALIA